MSGSSAILKNLLKELIATMLAEINSLTKKKEEGDGMNYDCFVYTLEEIEEYVCLRCDTSFPSLFSSEQKKHFAKVIYNIKLEEEEEFIKSRKEEYPMLKVVDVFIEENDGLKMVVYKNRND